ncbi:permease [Alkalihalobacillus hemicellulosilyticus]|uniref:Transporter n=1 Tax=Halalkalibacter hemicellulosilyticusJCM 9152 TaxID=1236971 RepID=W4QHR1_9BACI|nr:permease [Halalkalibacter hemicellulosilyticus]GAE31636.1 transporter [Halalkalibacter hemicellulosilyticusJCM 9152]
MFETFKSFLIIAAQLTILFVGVSFLLNLIQAYIPYDKVKKHLKNSNPVVGGVIALLFAFITPFCSCSTIPVILNLLKNHVRFGVVMVFLFASPVLDPTILTIMTVIMGWKVTILYIIITASLSLIIGLLLEKFGFEKSLKNVVMSGYEHTSKTFSWRNAWKETWDLMKSVYPYLLIGAAIGAIIHGLVPAEFISTYFGSDVWWLIPLAAIVGIPLYIRLSSMIPISQILIVNGMALGPVMAMMISSAGASLPELVLLKAIFKKELIVMFVISVLSMSTISGFIFYFI